MTPEALQVLADHLHELETPEDATEMARWLKYPGAVRMLLGWRGRCGCIHARCHVKGCWFVAALHYLRHPALKEVRAHQREFAGARRTARLQKLRRAAMTQEQRDAEDHTAAVLVSTMLRGVLRNPLGMNEPQPEDTIVSAGLLDDYDPDSGPPIA